MMSLVPTRIARISVLIATICGRQAFAQTPVRDSARLDSVKAVLLSFPLESPIRIETVGHNVIEGFLSTRTDTGIVVRQRRGSASASVVRIATISRAARNLKSGTMIGALSGGLIGALALGELSRGLCDSADCSNAFTDGALVGAGYGAGVGALLGALFGALTCHWEPVWP